MPRHVSLNCGIPIDKPALGINRLCGSGFQAVINGAQDILTGIAKVSLTGGTDNMTQTPYVARNMRFGVPLGQNVALEDGLWTSLTDTYCKLPMALTAENLAVKYNIPREVVDQYALRSQQQWARAQKEGVFDAEITAVQLKVKGKEIDFSVDEHPPATDHIGGPGQAEEFVQEGRHRDGGNCVGEWGEEGNVVDRAE